MSVFGLASNVRVRTKGFKGAAPNTPTLDYTETYPYS